MYIVQCTHDVDIRNSNFMSSNDGTFSQRKYNVVNYLLVPRVCIEKKICMYLQYCANHLESLSFVPLASNSK